MQDQSRAIQTRLSREDDLGATLATSGGQVIPDWDEGKQATPAEKAEAGLRGREVLEMQSLELTWPTNRLLLIVVRYLLWAMSKRLLPKPDADSRLGKDLARLAAMVGADQEEAGGGKLGLGAKL